MRKETYKLLENYKVKKSSFIFENILKTKILMHHITLSIDYNFNVFCKIVEKIIKNNKLNESKATTCQLDFYKLWLQLFSILIVTHFPMMLFFPNFKTSWKVADCDLLTSSKS